MDVTPMTWAVAMAGLGLMLLLGGLQLVAVLRPRSAWTIENVYGGEPDATDPTAYFAFNQGMAWADVFFWAPLQKWTSSQGTGMTRPCSLSLSQSGVPGKGERRVSCW